jgi:tricorn protease interacting factor F2/3
MGAMENFGAIRHAEDVLLVYPGVTSKVKETLINKIIAHESIHMWFGDLVSPAGWKYLWLSEAFATYFTYVIPHFYYPEWGVWNQFFLERLLPGLERDSLAGTIPIDLPGVDDPTADPAPTPSSAPIVYNKGAAILRMLAAYLGEETFRQGLHDFLEQYQFEAASSGQFWIAIEQSTGKPVARFAKTWIYQAGYPIVEVQRRADILHLTQKRFTYSSESSEDTWVIPVDILLFLEDGEIQLDHVVLADREIAFNLPKNTSAYKLNAAFTGFYRVHYPEEAWAELGKLIQQKKLSAVDSLNILNDFFASVKAGRHTVGEYLRYIETNAYVEDRYLPLTDLVKNLSQIYLTVEAKRAEIRRLGIPIVEHNLDQIGYQPSKDETSVTTELRETLIWVAFLWGSQKVTAFAKLQFQAFLEKKSVSGDLLAVILKIGAATHEQGQEALLKMATDTNRAEIERIMALEALGYLPDQKQQVQMLKENLSEVPNSLRSYMINATGQNPAARDIMWNWFVQNLSQLESLPQTVIEHIIVGIVPMCGLGHGTEVHQCLDKFLDRHPNSKDSIRMAFELLAVNDQLRSN